MEYDTRTDLTISDSEDPRYSEARVILDFDVPIPSKSES